MTAPAAASVGVISCPYGGPLRDLDYSALERSWIPRELAEQAMLRRVASFEGAEIVGRRDDGSCEGIIFPHIWPGEDHIREYRLRRDRPELERDAEGQPKEKNKYLGPPGRGNLLYVTPGTPAEFLADVRLPVAITEGAKKTLALHRLAAHRPSADGLPAFLPIGLGGVWSFRGTIGKIEGADGARRDEKGLISDLRRIAWKGRRTYIVFDLNVHTNPKVAAARRELSKELIGLGAEVHWVTLPKPEEVPGVNGVDDLLAAWGPERVLGLFDASEPMTERKLPRSQVQRLIQLCEDVELFCSPDGESYAYVPVGDHRETWTLRNRGFARWLSHQFHRIAGKPPRNQALQEAIGFLEARAQFDSPVKPVWVRIAEQDGKIYIDLCNPNWEVVEIDHMGWRVVSDAAVRFRRTKGMHPLPHPVWGGSATVLRSFINVGNDNNWILCLCWMLAALRPQGPYPILLLQGEQGTAKSTMERLLRRIIDPVSAPVRTPPRNDRDLLIAAVNSWVVAYDNLSGIPHWLSDALCRLATGGGFSTRELYTNSDEVIFDAMRPVILNGIDHLAERPDLADRALILQLPRILSSERRDERQIYSQFEQELPKILGALYTAVSKALSRIGHVTIAEKPRMADFALWAFAGMPGFDLPGEAFLAAYMGNRAEAVEDTLEGDCVATALLDLLERNDDQWTGTCQQLMQTLQGIVDEPTKKTPAWPATPRGLSSRLRRIVTFMGEAGIEIAFLPKSGRGQRLLTIKRNLQTTAATAVTATGSADE